VPLLTRVELEKAIGLLKMRGISLYHACGLKDLRSYLEVGGIPSRELMERSGLAFTQFDTDDDDHENGVWAMVFVNLQDFGQGFACGEWRDSDKAPVPNPYGPILIKMRPDALREAEDVAVCLRSAGGRGFQRDAESLGTVDDIGRLFKYSSSERGPQRGYLKWSEDLQKEFPELRVSSAGKHATWSPEVSCRVQAGFLPFRYAEDLIVDKYEVAGQELIKLVVGLVVQSESMECETGPRHYEYGRDAILSDLVQAWRHDAYSLEQVVEHAESQSTCDWARRVRACGLEYQFNRFMHYLADGTLSQVAAGRRF